MIAPAARLLRCIAALLLAGGVIAGSPVASGAEPPPGAPAPAAKPENVPADPNDLGQGLRYLRVGNLDAEAATVEAALTRPVVILDLRGANAGAAATARFAAALQQTANPAKPVFVLVGPDTPAALRAAIPDSPSSLTVGAAANGVSARIAVKTDPARDRAACAALAAGAAPASLIEEKVEKRRFDEARLAHAHAAGSDNSSEESDRPESSAMHEKDPSATPPADAPLKDLVLQRAVFLHRALIALGRLPEPAAEKEQVARSK
jgi:hypothetical protein